MTPTPKPDAWPSLPLVVTADNGRHVSIWHGSYADGELAAMVHGTDSLPKAESRDAAIDLARQFAAAPKMLAMLDELADRIAVASGTPGFSTGDKAALDALIAEARDGAA